MRGNQEFLSQVEVVTSVEAARRPSLRRVGELLWGPRWAITRVRLCGRKEDDELHQRAEIRLSLEMSKFTQERRQGKILIQSGKPYKDKNDIICHICLISKWKCSKCVQEMCWWSLEPSPVEGKLTCTEDETQQERHCQTWQRLKDEGLCSST